MKILITGLIKAVNELKLLYVISFIVAIIVLIPIANFLIEGFSLILGGNFSLGLSGREEILGSLKLLFLTKYAIWKLYFCWDCVSEPFEKVKIFNDGPKIPISTFLLPKTKFLEKSYPTYLWEYKVVIKKKIVKKDNTFFYYQS